MYIEINEDCIDTGVAPVIQGQTAKEARDHRNAFRQLSSKLKTLVSDSSWERAKLDAGFAGFQFEFQVPADVVWVALSNTSGPGNPQERVTMLAKATSDLKSLKQARGQSVEKFLLAFDDIAKTCRDLGGLPDVETLKLHFVQGLTNTIFDDRTKAAYIGSMNGTSLVECMRHFHLLELNMTALAGTSADPSDGAERAAAQGVNKKSRLGSRFDPCALCTDPVRAKTHPTKAHIKGTKEEVMAEVKRRRELRNSKAEAPIQNPQAEKDRDAAHVVTEARLATSQAETQAARAQLQAQAMMLASLQQPAPAGFRVPQFQQPQQQFHPYQQPPGPDGF
jgi:hypothetical protein